MWYTIHNCTEGESCIAQDSFFCLQKLQTKETLREGAHCLGDNGFAPTETKCVECSDSEKNMSAYADQNHAPSLTCVRLELLICRNCKQKKK